MTGPCCAEASALRPSSTWLSRTGLTRIGRPFRTEPERDRMVSETAPCGGMAEWTMAAVLKTVMQATVSWVRIPLPPPHLPIYRYDNCYTGHWLPQHSGCSNCAAPWLHCSLCWPGQNRVTLKAGQCFLHSFDVSHSLLNQSRGETRIYVGWNQGVIASGAAAD